jgi:hypothetical protein
VRTTKSSTGRYSYATFVDGIDRYIELRCPRGLRARIFSAPVIAHYREGGASPGVFGAQSALQIKLKAFA